MLQISNKMKVNFLNLIRGINTQGGISSLHCSRFIKNIEEKTAKKRFGGKNRRGSHLTFIHKYVHMCILYMLCMDILYIFSSLWNTILLVPWLIIIISPLALGVSRNLHMPQVTCCENDANLTIFRFTHL